MLVGGIMLLPNTKVIAALTVAPIIYGRNSRRKLTPLDNIAIISQLSAIFEVKKIKDINTNRGEN